MALNAYLTLEGGSQGEIKGSVTQAGREDTIMVIAFDHKVTSPRDAASGLPTGKRQHGPLTICKELDKSSPLLMQALTNNETIPTFRLGLLPQTSPLPHQCAIVYTLPQIQPNHRTASS